VWECAADGYTKVADPDSWHPHSKREAVSYPAGGNEARSKIVIKLQNLKVSIEGRDNQLNGLRRRCLELERSKLKRRFDGTSEVAVYMHPDAPGTELAAALRIEK
jgi:hypothetical protein